MPPQGCLLLWLGSCFRTALPKANCPWTGLQTSGCLLEYWWLCPITVIRYPAPTVFTLAETYVHLAWISEVFPSLACTAGSALLSQSGCIWLFPFLPGPSRFELDKLHGKPVGPLCWAYAFVLAEAVQGSFTPTVPSLTDQQCRAAGGLDSDSHAARALDPEPISLMLGTWLAHSFRTASAAHTGLA